MYRLAVAASVLLAGCSSISGDAPLRQRLDDATGATVTTLASPLVFYREQSLLAANARDYIYIGPVEVNRNGRRQYLLWVAYRSTIDRAGSAGFTAPAQTYLLLDGEPMDLPVATSMDRPQAGTHTLPGADEAEWLYQTSVGGGESVLFEVTRAQLLTIARAREVRIITAESAASAVQYEPWRTPATDFVDFSRYLKGDPTSRLALATEPGE